MIPARAVRGWAATMQARVAVQGATRPERLLPMMAKVSGAAAEGWGSWHPACRADTVAGRNAAGAPSVRQCHGPDPS